MAARPTQRLRVVVHVDEASIDRQRLALGNVANLLNDLGDANAEVEVVLNGPSISAATKGTELSGGLKLLGARGVTFLACSNSMHAAGIEVGDLDDVFGVVAAGITHLVRRQHEGWAYVRP